MKNVRRSDLSATTKGQPLGLNAFIQQGKWSRDPETFFRAWRQVATPLAVALATGNPENIPS